MKAMQLHDKFTLTWPSNSDHLREALKEMWVTSLHIGHIISKGKEALLL